MARTLIPGGRARGILYLRLHTVTASVSLIVRGKVAKTVSINTTFEKSGEPKRRNQTEVLLLTSLTSYR